MRSVLQLQLAVLLDYPAPGADGLDPDQLSVAKASSIVENGNDLRPDSKQDYALHSGRGVLRDLGKLPQHQFSRPVHLPRVGDAVRPAGDRDTANFLPARIGRLTVSDTLSLRAILTAFCDSAA